MKRVTRKSPWKLTLLLFLLAGTIAFMGALYIYKTINAPKVNTQGETKVFFIEKIKNFDQLCSFLEEEKIITNQSDFRLISHIKRFDFVPKEGRYSIEGNSSYNTLINMLRIGNRSPIKLTFNNVRTKFELAGVIASHLNFDSIAMLNALNNTALLSNHELNTQNVISIFIPNTYQIYWSTTEDEVIARFKREFDKFWTKERLEKAKALNLSKLEIITLASIVEEETLAKEEKPIVAGLYLNRIKRGILLQADPTLRFAWNDFEIKRVLNKHKLIDSPYNTYKYKGLPPGPIRLPEPSSIDAVLNYTKHSYLYMVAEADFSGRHHFSKTLREHNKYADIYRRELNRRRIYK